MPIDTGPSNETTLLTPDEKHRMKLWAAMYKINDVNKETGDVYPDANYDMAGYFKANQMPPHVIGYATPHFPGGHYPDTWKQSTHPSFSQQSQYSSGPSQGGMWIGPKNETFLSQPPMAVSHRSK
jgi:hypothetical protein